MFDIYFDISTREIVMASDDFATTAHPSSQNGGILLTASCPNPLLPIFGVGINPNAIGSSKRNFVALLNRWQAQAYQDGATLAKWSITPGAGGEENLLNTVSYE